MEVSCSGFTLFLVISSMVFCSISSATDTLNVNQSLRVGETLVSSSGTFELGFFSPGSSGNWYLGKWYRNISVRTVIWVANRDTPIRDTTGVTLKVIQPSILAILNSKDSVIWSSNTSRSLLNPVAQLLGYGNFVVREANDGRPENFVWQSFDHPTDTYLPGMRFGWNYVTGLETYLLSWRGVDDPARGHYSFHLDPTGFPQIVLKRGNVVTYRLGNWNGVRFSGAVNPRDATSNGLVLVMNENEVSYVRSPSTSLLSRVTINLNGVVQRLRWVDGRGWMANLNMPADICDTYRLCGANGICNFGNSTPCRCLDRFVPRDPEGWERTDWENGCDRRRKLSCEGDVFFRYSGIKLPDARYSWHNTSMMLDECRHECLTNCSCTAYTQLDIERRIGCIFWFRGLIDVRSVSLNGQDIYIRMASSESDSDGKNRKILIASMTSGIGAVLIGLGLFIYIRKRKNDSKVKEAYDGSYFKDLELPSFDLSVVLTATDHFSFSNKIGEGGFGHVYKGMLEGGLEIAVKRMSKDSMQGLTELKNEGVFIAKLQHRNLVRLLGCCIQGEESMLVYEYMPNKSLDVLLFGECLFSFFVFCNTFRRRRVLSKNIGADNRKRMQLDWPKRFQIINGIARGLLYLHQDSRLRIIHRDLKASNVLLDSEMNPKISDFGIARSFVGNELEAAKTRRVVGT